MYEVFYYIFAALILLFSMFAAFSEKPGSILYYFVILLFSFSGLLVLLNSALISLMTTLLTSAVVMLFILFGKLDPAGNNENAGDTTLSVYLYLITAGMFTAIITSLVSSTRLPNFEIDFASISFTQIFSVYLPLLLLLAVVISAIVPFVASSLKKGESS
jgi:NADH:ubiquinone oxidoreductase subunit 6 (subunit J)